MLRLDDFIPITLDKKELFDKHYKKYPPKHSDNVFTTMISWMEYASYEYIIYDDALLIKTMIDNKIQLRAPIGNQSKEIFNMIFNLAKKEQFPCHMGLIEEPTKEVLESYYNDLEFIRRPEYEDYVYLASDLSTLAGSKYAKIRNRLNKFTKNHAYTMEDIQYENLREVKQFLKRWCIWRDCEDDPLLDYERKAVQYSINHFHELGLSGLAVRVNDKIEAIAVYEKMNEDTLVVHFEKGSPDYDGIYKLINNETAKKVENDVTYINRESNMGNIGLRKAKESYKPDHMIQVYEIAPKKKIKPISLLKKILHLQ